MDKRSSANWLPLFNYQTGDDGLITGLGWSGAWRAYFDHQGSGNSTILAGVENFDSILHPGETVRSTLNLALYWKGELLHGQNMFRKLMLQHYSPRVDRKLAEPPISGVVWGVSGKWIRENGFEVAIPNRRDSRLISYSVDRTDKSQ